MDLEIVDDRLLIANDYGFTVLDISSPTRPVLIESDNPWSYPRTVAATSDLVLTSNGNGGFEIFDISRCPRSPVVMPPTAVVVD